MVLPNLLQIGDYLFINETCVPKSWQCGRVLQKTKKHAAIEISGMMVVSLWTDRLNGMHLSLKGIKTNRRMLKLCSCFNAYSFAHALK